jgi:very-short-patch-repair endonuclease
LAVEIGRNIYKGRRDYDDFRDKYLEGIGIKTLRFSNDEINNSIDNVINIIKKRYQNDILY